MDLWKVHPVGYGLMSIVERATLLSLLQVMSARDGAPLPVSRVPRRPQKRRPRRILTKFTMARTSETPRLRPLTAKDFTLRKKKSAAETKLAYTPTLYSHQAEAGWTPVVKTPGLESTAKQRSETCTGNRVPRLLRVCQ